MRKCGSLKLVALLTIASGCTQQSPTAAQGQERPGPAKSQVDIGALTKRARPGPEHLALQPLVGCWNVEKSVFAAIGSPEAPARSKGMTTERRWVGDGRFLESKTVGTIGGQPYSRMGFLGYNPMDRRFEWTTIDNITPIMMVYQGPPQSGPLQRHRIEMVGTFTDLGVTGEENVGKAVRQRTLIEIADNDRHTFEIYFQAPDQPEKLADKMVFSRTECATRSGSDSS